MFFLICFFLALTIASSSSASRHISHVSHRNYFNVLDYGAVGDGVRVDNKAFENTWKAACSSNRGSPTMHVPYDKTFLLQPIVFSGPCSSHSINFVIEGDLIAPSDPKQWSCNLDGNNCKQWISFDHQKGLHISGNGSLNGKGQQWWRCRDQSCKKRPHTLTLRHSTRVQLSNLTFIDSPQIHIFIKGSTWVNATSLTIRAPGDSPNTDGIHLQDSQNVSVTNSHIGTGDDCISMGDGTAHVDISSIICGPGHGISVGSLGINGEAEKVENIHVSEVEFRGSTNGVRIKTWQGGRGYAKNIVFEKIKSVGARRPIIIDQNYCAHSLCRKHESAVQISNITFSDITGTSRDEDAIIIECSEFHPCTNIKMKNIKLHSARRNKRAKSTCVNVDGMRFLNVSPLIRCLAKQY